MELEKYDVGIFSRIAKLLEESRKSVIQTVNTAMVRTYYEIEVKKSNWSLRELRRQFDSALYKRFVLSKDKNQEYRYVVVR